MSPFVKQDRLVLDPLLQRVRLDVVRKHDKEYDGDDSLFILKDRPVYYYWQEHDAVITIPVGTTTNFASLPPFIRVGNPVNSLHRYPALIHDYLYHHGGILAITHEIDMSAHSPLVVEATKPRVLRYSRESADSEFKRFMIYEGVHAARAWYMHKAVALCGGRHRRKTSLDKTAWLV
jgi:hypothetical protein